MSGILICPIESEHLPALLEIANHIIRHTVAMWREEELDLAFFQTWLDKKKRTDMPAFVALIGKEAVGYTSLRPHADYHATSEHNVHVHHDHRGKGLGTALLETLIRETRARKFHTMLGETDPDNTASLKLHEKLGFQQIGILREVGKKHGRYLDNVIMQKLLD